jgi:alkylation response protein AidB-like acyl-CoA dehydrogenase
MALQVVDRAIQSFGAEGVSQDQALAHTWAGLRTLRLADVSLPRGYFYHNGLTYARY